MGSRYIPALVFVLMACMLLNVQCVTVCALQACAATGHHEDAPPCHESNSGDKSDCVHPVIPADQIKAPLANLVGVVAMHSPGAVVEAASTFAPLALVDSSPASEVSSFFTVLRI